MDAVRLSRVTTVLAVAAVGGVAGHVLWPFSAGAAAWRPAAFASLMLATGALRGWREAVAAESPATLTRAALYAAGALAAALLGHVVAHGLPG